MPPTTVKSLSDVIQKKTGGMILFAINLLKSLHDAHLITFNLTTLRWEFHLERIIETEISSDIIKFLSDQISCLPSSIQAGLRIASCLGSTFSSSVFQRANKSSDDETDDFISFVIENGYLQELSPNQFTWSHDQVYQAAYSLTPPDLRDSTHLLVGTRIYLSTKNDEILGLIHDIVRNMNVGIDLLESQEQRADLAELNLLAGEQSIKASAFYTGEMLISFHDTARNMQIFKSKLIDYGSHGILRYSYSIQIPPIWDTTLGRRLAKWRLRLRDATFQLSVSLYQFVHFSDP